MRLVAPENKKGGCPGSPLSLSPIYFLLRERDIYRRRMESFSFSYPLYAAGSSPSLQWPTLETGPGFHMEEEEREPQTSVAHREKCLLLPLSVPVLEAPDPCSLEDTE